MPTKGTDRDWNVWGAENPYFGVISHPKFLDENLNDETLQEFFASGESHIQHVYEAIRAGVQPAFQPSRVIDYGCGVGRLVVPLAQRAETVVGIDVSHGMLVQARENCATFGAPSAALLHVDEMDSLEPASFGLAHSYMVFQHIPVARGELILRKLIALLEEGGVGALHFTYSGSQSALRRSTLTMIDRVGPLRGLRNLRNHLPWSAPAMQMNRYSMHRIFDILIEEHCSNLHVEFSDHSGNRGAMLYFEKSPKPLL